MPRIAPQKPVMARVKPKAIRWHKLKYVARRLQQDVINVYNWKNRKVDPLPIRETEGGMEVAESVLLDWLAAYQPELVLVWHDNAPSTEEELAKLPTLDDRQSMFLRALQIAVKQATAS